MIWRKVITNHGEVIEIEIDFEFTEISFKNSIGEEIGKFEFSPNDGFEYYKLVWGYMDLKDKKYKHQGIGREGLIFFKEYTGGLIYANENDGLKCDDGSHLTGDAPTFVDIMRDEGIIEKIEEDIF